MAEVVNVMVGDTITSIVASKKSPQCHEMGNWIEKVVKLNPHVGDPDKIHPNEKLLIPDSLQENVSALDIWQNALRYVHSRPGAHHPGSIISK